MPRKGWKHPYTGDLIDPSDENLIGMGNPPHAPGAPGMGQVPLIPVMMTDAQATAAKSKADANRSGHSRRPNGFPQGEEF